MRKLLGAFFALLMLGLTLPRVADVAPIEWLGRISGMGGATAESWRRKSSIAGAEAHGFGQIEALGVAPLFLGFAPGALLPVGIQARVSYNGTNGHRFDMSLGPVYDWGGGKAGVFFEHQYRLAPQTKIQNREFARVRNWWITPSVSLYDIIPGTNIDIWHRQPLTLEYQAMSWPSDGYRNRRLIPYSQTRVAVNYFPNFLFGKDNLELTGGLQINALSGPGHENVALGAGPVLGIAFMPIAGLPLEVTLVSGTMDNKGRYNVHSGLQFYLSKENSTLLQLRRKYLEPTNLPGPVSTFAI